MLKKLSLLALLCASSVGFAADTVVNGKVWSVEYNTGSAFYSAAKGEQEVTMECLLGEVTFAAHDDETGIDFNSRDERVKVAIDGIIYKAPKTLQERTKFYSVVSNAIDSFQLFGGNGEESKVYPIQELRSLFQSVEFDLSDCKE